MKKLFTLTDTFRRDLPFVTAPDYINYYDAPDGSGIKIPSEATYVGISVVPAEINKVYGAWFKLGASDSPLAAPSSDIVDGTAPNFVANGEMMVTWVEDNDYVYVVSGDPVLVEFWS